jgi:hypothetical protein
LGRPGPHLGALGHQPVTFGQQRLDALLGLGEELHRGAQFRVLDLLAPEFHQRVHRAPTHLPPVRDPLRENVPVVVILCLGDICPLDARGNSVGENRLDRAPCDDCFRRESAEVVHDLRRWKRPHHAND